MPRYAASSASCAALDQFKPGLGDVAMVLAFTGLRWEEAVAVRIGNVNLDGQSITIDRTASESAGRRDVREDMKTRAAERTLLIASGATDMQVAHQMGHSKVDQEHLRPSVRPGPGLHLDRDEPGG